MYKYGLYSYGRYLYGIYKYGLYGHGLCRYGLYSYGLRRNASAVIGTGHQLLTLDSAGPRGGIDLLCLSPHRELRLTPTATRTIEVLAGDYSYGLYSCGLYIYGLYTMVCSYGL